MALRIGDDVSSCRADGPFGPDAAASQEKLKQNAAAFQNSMQVAQAAVPLPGPVPLVVPPVAVPGTNENRQFTDNAARLIIQGYHNLEEDLEYTRDQWNKGNYLGAINSVFNPVNPRLSGWFPADGVSPPPPLITPIPDQKPQIVSTPTQEPAKPQAVGGGFQGETIDTDLPGFVPPALPIDTTKVEIRKADEEREKSRAKGIPDSELGPSGKPKRYVVKHPSRKDAEEWRSTLSSNRS